MNTVCRIIVLLPVILLISCDEETHYNGGDPAVETRTFALGFTGFSHDGTVQGLLDVFEIVERDGDLAAMHFDGGVPWQEALEGSDYPDNFQSELTGTAGLIPAGHHPYLAVTPINFARDGLAPYQGETSNEPLPPPWDTLSFDHPDVITAFTNHCKRMIDQYMPDYMTYAIEANMLHTASPDSWGAFVTLISEAYAALKSAHPDLPLMISLQAEFFHGDPASQAQAIQQLLPYTDYIAVSSYAFLNVPDPAHLNDDYLQALADLAPGKPFAIAETAWPAEDLTDPYPVLIPADENRQNVYVTNLLAQMDGLAAMFVVWFFPRDYDTAWESTYQHLSNAATLRIWRDCGIHDGEGNPRPALETWLSYLERPLQ